MHGWEGESCCNTKPQKKKIRTFEGEQKTTKYENYENTYFEVIKWEKERKVYENEFLLKEIYYPWRISSHEILFFCYYFLYPQKNIEIRGFFSVRHLVTTQTTVQNYVNFYQSFYDEVLKHSILNHFFVEFSIQKMILDELYKDIHRKTFHLSTLERLEYQNQLQFWKLFQSKMEIHHKFLLHSRQV